jgi:hypothetical protein
MIMQTTQIASWLQRTAETLSVRITLDAVIGWIFTTPVSNLNSLRRLFYVPPAVGQTVSGCKNITILKDDAAAKRLSTVVQSH